MVADYIEVNGEFNYTRHDFELDSSCRNRVYGNVGNGEGWGEG